jgi:hypothetical protein
MGKSTRPADGWAHLLDKIIQPGGPLGRAALLVLACTPLAVAIAVVITGVIVLSR